MTEAGNYAIDVFRRANEAASSTASSLFEGGKGIVEQMGMGWEQTREKMELPIWLQQILRQDGSGSQSGDSDSGGGPKQSNAGVAAGAATGAAFGYEQSPEDDTRSSREAARDDQMMVLTRKMIEIRSMLNQVGQSGSLSLPSIVVIGSQSSGKSSVLEAIVGHEFLPKGSNMVTRRPIELTLVNTPSTKAEYGEFPALGLGKITDFSQIQRTLTDLNLAVPAEVCVTNDPIQLSIYSPNVPDLSMIDLPGYIQVSGQDQPVQLKQKISDLCDKYIQPPNIILAISAADVDLANSTALRASRRVDPRGERTIGVITKMDLVDPARGAELLSDRKYPLRLGYVGVVCRIPQSPTGLFARAGGNITLAITKNENAYFSSHPLEFGGGSDVAVGTTTLRKKLMYVLEQTMASSLNGTREAIIQELEEAAYEFKVQYNDRPLSAESYLAENLDGLKHSFKEFTEQFGRPQVRELLKQALDQRVLDLLAKRYWNKPIDDLSPATIPEPDPLSDLSKSDPLSPIWSRKLNASTSELTKLGIGRLATTVVSASLQEHIDQLIAASTFASHPYAQRAIAEASSGILNDRFYSTSDQVENCIKPYKFETQLEVEDNEWVKGRESITKVLKEELKACETAQRNLEDHIGRRKLKDVTAFVKRVRNGEVVLDGSINGSSPIGGAGGFSADLLSQGRTSLFLSDRTALLNMRLQFLRSARACTPSVKSAERCPEVYLSVLADKLTATAVLFLHVELLSEFVYRFPRELDARLGKGLAREEAERLAREDPRVRRHLDVVRKKEGLEEVLGRIEGLREMGMGVQRRTRNGKDGRGRGEGGENEKREGGKGWSLF